MYAITLEEDMRHFDVVIVGAGSAAFAAAIKASDLGATVAMIESGAIGGTCVNVGCIPSKNLIEAADLYHSVMGPNRYRGLSFGRAQLDFAGLIEQKDQLVTTLRQKKYLDVAQGREGISIMKGQGHFIGPQQIVVNEEVVTGRQVLIATGTRACIPPFPGLESVPYLTSTEAFMLKKLPVSMMIIGGGVIALELGQMFQRFGVRVTILERGPHVLSGFDEEVAHSIQGLLQNEGLNILTHTTVAQVGQSDTGVTVRVHTNGQTHDLTGETLLIACGRVPNTDHLDLDKAGVEVDDRDFVKVNEEMQTTHQSIWAAGDVTGPPLATPVGAREGVIAAENMLTGKHRRMDYSIIPRAVFTEPEVASVGLTATEARQQGIRVKADCLDLKHVPKAAAIYKTGGLVNMVVEEDTDRIIGVHLVADRGADLIHEAALAIKCRLTTQDLIDMIHVYPTMSESIRMAAQIFQKDVSTLSCCAE